MEITMIYGIVPKVGKNFQFQDMLKRLRQELKRVFLKMQGLNKALAGFLSDFVEYTHFYKWEWFTVSYLTENRRLLWLNIFIRQYLHRKLKVDIVLIFLMFQVAILVEKTYMMQ